MPKLNHSETDKKLTAALLALIEHKPLHCVQVSELCGRARVHRATFYKHYEGIPDFIDQIERSFLSQMDAMFPEGNVFLLSVSIDAREIYTRCVRFMRANSNFVAPMIGINGSISFRRKLLYLWECQAEEALMMLSPIVMDHFNVELLSSCIAASMLSLLEIDLLNPGKYSAEYFADQMAGILYGCMLKGAMKSFGTSG